MMDNKNKQITNSNLSNLSFCPETVSCAECVSILTRRGEMNSLVLRHATIKSCCKRKALCLEKV